MTKIEIEVPDNKEVKWVNNVLTLIDKQQDTNNKPNFKFNIGDTVKFKGDTYKYTVQDRKEILMKPSYLLRADDGIMYKSYYSESEIEPYPKSKNITDIIKTFEDAMTWCGKNGKNYLCEEYCTAMDVGLLECASDIAAYLKLRIITCALNEGWKPTFEYGEDRWYIYTDACDTNDINTQYKRASLNYQESSRLLFKSKELAEYAATQFKDIYMDFCCKRKK